MQSSAGIDIPSRSACPGEKCQRNSRAQSAGAVRLPLLHWPSPSPLTSSCCRPSNMLALRSGSSSRLCASSAGHACRVPSSNLSLKAFSTSIRCARQHPLEPRGGRAAPAASSSKPEQEQKWSSQTLVGLATFVGAATYLLAKATSNASDNNSIASSSSGSEIKIPKPSKSDFDAATAEIKKLLPADAITSDHTAVESCVAPWSCVSLLNCTYP